MIRVRITQMLRNFRSGEDGVMTVFGIFLLLVTLMIGGLAIDVANAMRLRTHLQVAADSAAHAALVVMTETNSEADAKLTAIEVASGSMPLTAFGETIKPADIVFGNWNETTRTFTLTTTDVNAVRVDASQIEERQNSVGTYFLKFAGFDRWNIVRESVYTTYIPTCMREGFVAENIVDVTTGNTYTSGFCIHSNDYVELNTDNTLQPGVIVSMPNKNDLVMPTDGFLKNTGLEDALRDGAYRLNLVARIDPIIAGVDKPGSVHYRSDYITSSTTETIDPSVKFDADVWTPGRVHYRTCSAVNEQVQIHTGTTLTDGVLVTNCLIKFGENVSLENVTIVNSNPSSNSFSGASGLRLGRDDDCAPGGGVQLVTKGGVAIPQYLQMYGAQILAGGDVSFTSDATGIEGASIISGGRIDGTSDSVMGFCGGAGMENNFYAWYFRMAA